MHEDTRQLIDELEHEARQRAVGLEALGRLPGPKKCPPLGFVHRYYPLTSREQAELRRLKGAAALATDAATYVALARGDAIPISRANQAALAHVRKARG